VSCDPFYVHKEFVIPTCTTRPNGTAGFVLYIIRSHHQSTDAFSIDFDDQKKEAGSAMTRALRRAALAFVPVSFFADLVFLFVPILHGADRGVCVSGVRFVEHEFQQHSDYLSVSTSPER
jgi:hypothetical protein